MKRILFVLALIINASVFSQTVTLIGTFSVYTAAHGKMTYKEVFESSIKVEVSELVNVTYEFDLDLQTITYNVNGIIATKSFTSLKYDKKAKIAVFTFNDMGTEKTGKRVSIPVTVELNINPGKESVLISWFDYEGDNGNGVTMVQNTYGKFNVN